MSTSVHTPMKLIELAKEVFDKLYDADNLHSGVYTPGDGAWSTVAPSRPGPIRVLILRVDEYLVRIERSPASAARDVDVWLFTGSGYKLFIEQFRGVGSTRAHSAGLAAKVPLDELPPGRLALLQGILGAF